MSCAVPGSAKRKRKDQKGSSYSVDSVAKPACCQRARPRCWTRRRVLPTTDTMPGSRKRCLDGRVLLPSSGMPSKGERAGPGPETRRRDSSNLGTGRGRATSPARTSAPGAGPAPSALPAAAAGVRLAAVGPVSCGDASWGLSQGWSVFGSRVPGNPLGAGRRANGELGWAPGTRPQVSGPGPKATGPGRLQYLLQWSLAEPHCLSPHVVY